MVKRILSFSLMLFGTSIQIFGMQDRDSATPCSSCYDMECCDYGLRRICSSASFAGHSESPYIIDSPHSITPGPRCDSPALFGLVHQLLRRPIYELDQDGTRKVNFDFTDVPRLIQFARLCENLDEDGLLGIIFTGIQKCGSTKLYTDDSPVQILTKIKDTAGEQQCVAVLSWQSDRYIIAKNGKQWIFVDLQYQSERAGERPGAHSEIYDSLNNLIPKLEEIWIKLKTTWNTLTSSSPLTFEFEGDEPPYLMVKYYRAARE